VTRPGLCLVGLQGHQGRGLPLPLCHQDVAVPALVIGERHRGSGPTPLCGFLNRHVDLPNAPVEIPDDVGLLLDAGPDRRGLLLGGRHGRHMHGEVCGRQSAIAPTALTRASVAITATRTVRSNTLVALQWCLPASMVAVIATMANTAPGNRIVMPVIEK
jgi:hypothetical protein